MKRTILLFAVVALLTGLPGLAGMAWALEVNKPAPDFTLSSTTGKKITLSQYRGQKMVFLEFYAVNFGAT